MNSFAQMACCFPLRFPSLGYRGFRSPTLKVYFSFLPFPRHLTLFYNIEWLTSTKAPPPPPPADRILLQVGACFLFFLLKNPSPCSSAGRPTLGVSRYDCFFSPFLFLLGQSTLRVATNGGFSFFSELFFRPWVTKLPGGFFFLFFCG